MILDFSSRPDEARLYEVLDAETGEPIDEPIFYAEDERGFYRRGVYLRPGTGDIAIRQVPGTGEPVIETVHRPIRIVPRLERLCASLRADLASLGVPADDIPEPVLGALSLFQERLERLERRFTEAIAHPMLMATNPEPSPEDIEESRRLIREYRHRPLVIAPAPRRSIPRSEEEIRRITGASSPPVNSAEWLESVTRPDPAFAADPNHHLVRGMAREATTDLPYGRPWTRADLERFLPEVRVESVTTPERRRERCLPRIGEENVCQRCGGWISPDIDYPCPAAI